MASDGATFYVGGSVPAGSIYVTRAADRVLPERLAQGDLCFVLAPRQIGKSSLRVRAAAALQALGARCATVDLSIVGVHVTQEEWYFGVVQELADGLDVEDDPAEFWGQHALLPPVQRFVRYLRDMVLGAVEGRIVVFIDEIDHLLSLGFRDDFFASIRATWNLRAEDETWRRLTFCMLGVASPSELISDPFRTPFNVGTMITVEDFTRVEMDALGGALARTGFDPAALLDRVFGWTDGHPYMTIRVCDELLTRHQKGILDEDVNRAVEDIVEKVFLRQGRASHANLSDAERRILRDPRPGLTSRMLQLYERVLASGEVASNGEDPLHGALRLTGIAAERPEGDGRVLRTRNRVFAKIFDLAWLRSCKTERLLGDAVSRWLASSKSDDLVLRGQPLEEAMAWSHTRSDVGTDELAFLNAGIHRARRAERRLLVGALGAAVVLVGLLSLALFQWQQAAKDRRVAETERHAADVERGKAELAAEEARRARENAERAAEEARNAKEDAQRLALANEQAAYVARDDEARARGLVSQVTKDASNQTIGSETRIRGLVDAMEQQRKACTASTEVVEQLRAEAAGLTKSLGGVRAELANCNRILASRGNQ